ncbi:MAG: membrane protein insertion efficiency factor YidD [Propionibacteriaceae bacterium]|jgi:putative membrane protein insertion efficiency factor|nr:membrane protein insertion efficiency factor YidD [Propionibacteriaceae bacterium]
MKYVLIGFVRVWRAVVSPLYGANGDVCKYYPSCSAYGLEALRVHGAIKGTYLMVARILRCNPWSMGGIDPVPGSALEAEIVAERAGEAAEKAGRADMAQRRVNVVDGFAAELADQLTEMRDSPEFAGSEQDEWDVSRETFACC